MIPRLALSLVYVSVPAFAQQAGPPPAYFFQSYWKSSNPDPVDGFGVSCAISGDTAVVGCIRESSASAGVDGDQSDNSAFFSGAAYVFVRENGTWVQQAYLKPSTIHGDERFGISVDVSGDTIVVGAYFEDGGSAGVDGDEFDQTEQNSGAAYVFVRSGTTWTQQAYLKASNPDADDQFGRSVSVSGDTIVVGSSGEDSLADGVNQGVQGNGGEDVGAAYVFVRDNGTWSQQAYLKASNSGNNDSFGQSVAISGDTVIVGARIESSSSAGVNGAQNNDMHGSGAAYVFVRVGSSWSEQAFLKASNPDTNANFGNAVALDGDTAIVGAFREDGLATGVNGDQTPVGDIDSGAAYVFVRNGGVWSQQAYLKASNTEVGDNFGESVAIQGDTAVVGCRIEDSDANSVDGDGSNNDAVEAGAAYAYRRDGSTWTHVAYLKAPNAASDARFGTAVSTYEQTVLVTAPGENGSSVGIGGDPNDVSPATSDTGAAYVFGTESGMEPLTGCPGEGAITHLSPPSASSGLALHAPAFSLPCFGPVVTFFGACAESPLLLPPPIGCAYCYYVISDTWGSVTGDLVAGPGLPIGFELCAQSACVAAPSFLCVDLSQGIAVTVGP
ncbi:MAG: integrin [Planctomycetes bacterium]|nr:integrin [Planctomycetota bacterium]